MAALAELRRWCIDSGTPQGGLLSPLLSNIALSLIEERYERYVWPRAGSIGTGRKGPAVKPLTDPEAIARRACANRAADRSRGVPVFMPIRYCDDFVILVALKGADPDQVRELAEQEKAALAGMLKVQLGLTLSPEKTLITPVTSTMRFLGHHVRVRRRPSTRKLAPRLVVPKDRTTRLRQVISGIFRSGNAERNAREPAETSESRAAGLG